MAKFSAKWLRYCYYVFHSMWVMMTKCVISLSQNDSLILSHTPLKYHIARI